MKTKPGKRCAERRCGKCLWNCCERERGERRRAQGQPRALSEYAREGRERTHNSHRIAERRVLLPLPHDAPEEPLVAVLLLRELEVVGVGLGALGAGGRAHAQPGVLERVGRREEVREAEARQGLDGKVGVVRRGRRGLRVGAVRGTTCRRAGASGTRRWML